MSTMAGPAPTPDLAMPSWTEPFATAVRAALARRVPLDSITRDWAFGGIDGTGVRVAIVDSGIEADHPAVGGRVVESLRVVVEDGVARVVDDPDGVDVVGHGTAIAGLVHAVAPGAELVSIRMLGPDNRGRGSAFAAANTWAIEARVDVVNLSLSSRSEEYHAILHELADEAYFANVLLVCAANNAPGPSYPSLFGSVISVAAHDLPDPAAWFYNPRPPVEFGAHGVDVDVAWRDGSRIVATGNSFAAPVLTGHAALIRAKHPDIAPFEVKAILAATATPPAPA
jgi:subtilisin family serine protease